jgi:hypothetical protein
MLKFAVLEAADETSADKGFEGERFDSLVDWPELG